MTTYEKIKILCEKEGFSISSMPQKIPGLSISKSSIAGWKNGSVPRPERLKTIADYFGVSISFLMDSNVLDDQIMSDDHRLAEISRTAVAVIQDNNSVLSEQEVELVNMFRKLDIVKQARLLVKADELLKDR